MEASEEAPQVADVPEVARYEIHLGGELAGFADYRLGEGSISFVHTEVGDAFEGRGVGGRLIRHALDDARRRDLAVLPFCPFVRGWIERHPDYLPLVPGDQRERFSLPPA